jgi:hypothetical protein
VRFEAVPCAIDDDKIRHFEGFDIADADRARRETARPRI